MGFRCLVWILLLQGVVLGDTNKEETTGLTEETVQTSDNPLASNSNQSQDTTHPPDLVAENTTESGTNTSNVFINCSRTENLIQEVELVNSTRLLSLLAVNVNVTRAMAADCLVVYFYARWCPFSTMAAPHFNALPRAYPHIRMVAVDSMKYHSFNTQFGVVGIPMLILFHNGRPAAKFNESEYTLEKFSSFITKFTTIPPVEKMFVTSADFNGPVPSSIVRETDYFLWLSWAFLAFSSVIFFCKSSWCGWLVEAVKNTWIESGEQRPHMD